MQRDTPPFEHAVQFLAGQIRAARRNHRERLPPLRELAAGARVSQTTMIKAVALYRAQRVLLVSRGRGIRVAPGNRGRYPLDPPSAEPCPRRKWRRIARTIQRDTIAGRYAPGAPLPPPKRLAATYHVCYRTVRKALQALVDDGVLVEDKRAFRVPAITRPDRRANTIVLVARGDSFGEPSLVTSRTQDHLRFLEDACSRAGVRLDVVACHYILRELQGIEILQAMLADQSRADTILGFMVWTAAITEEYLRLVLELLGTSGKPVAILDEDKGTALDGVCGRTLHYTMAIGEQPGRDMARYLLRLGHRDIAFVTSSFSSVHSRARLQGLRREYTAAGFPDAVRPITALRPEKQPWTESPADDQNALLEMLVPRYVERTQGRFSVRERMAVLMSQELSIARRMQRRRDALFPALEALMRDTKVTAWVGNSDTDALVALDFLRLSGIAVPGRISVAGFDDSYEAFAQKLTSYNFNGSAYVNAMLESVLRPGRWDSRKTTQPIAIDGRIVQRASVAEAAGAR